MGAKLACIWSCNPAPGDKVFIDESGLSERPTLVRTWAPTGQTPIIPECHRQEIQPCAAAAGAEVGGAGSPSACRSTASTATCAPTVDRVVFACSNDRVYLSEDAGEHWVSVAAGLPRSPHCADLRVGRSATHRSSFSAPSDGRCGGRTYGDSRRAASKWRRPIPSLSTFDPCPGSIGRSPAGTR